MRRDLKARLCLVQRRGALLHEPLPVVVKLAAAHRQFPNSPVEMMGPGLWSVRRTSWWTMGWARKVSKDDSVFFVRMNNSTRALPDEECSAYLASRWPQFGNG